jgi:hypothetical protein
MLLLLLLLFGESIGTATAASNMFNGCFNSQANRQ